MAGGTEGAVFALIGAHEHIGAGTHTATDKHRLSDAPQSHRQARMARSESPGSAFAVNEETSGRSRYAVLLDLARVVGDVVDHI